MRSVSAGGGLAAGKVRREINVGAGGRGQKVKYVTAKWVVDSVEAGRKVCEKKYMDWRFTDAGQGSVMKYFGAVKTNDDEDDV